MQDLELPSAYNSPTYGRLEWAATLKKIVWFLGRDTQGSYEIIIGTDSQGYNGKSVDFVSAIIVHKKGRGGIYFWGKYEVKHLNSLKQRIWQEAFTSLTLAQNLVDDFSKMGILNGEDHTKEDNGLNLEIHVDIGPNGETRDLITDIVGMIRANGFKVATKPSSWGASTVADRHV
ncbi:hypothetical protein A3J17_05045 [Candidatus Curtissbacteria bacterium RIFCSPLOWO2_02_FULL_40_11]|uniref:DUF458 domain-containing protein n=2 Tax=Candidatus Curtissiibacteriota TaxID=1752717 RepID=A0A1F5G8G8_9BACT|nr:MAG: hypothetical protein A3D04_01570 [Candidatus Curtissbacteria bacterium RIFCSPHIGHO2_02_FULL_40_16b]OGD90089.1 MAG: hypothetical protein A3E11_01575 [Candidatus Curtissbacteria bacterium RIFCSPHIGHO2_12_FULL_38_37]OGE00502.1 MAG: hypothetical protein A3J17_05045 [Candidatus Curtissbacteria bacterium RIFCSPLOWO2_02_FULL_40_11]OGE13226.1 MAG: hypothetical protein A3G14_00430 [Candidatus Curtissbacteria bacterium RIFCSPLOWO2_12_FULL_38_9]